MLDNPAWHALHTNHAHLSVQRGAACRYPADVSPYAALESATECALRDLAELLTPGESVWVIAGELPPVKGLVYEEQLVCLQMLMPHRQSAAKQTHLISPLTCENAAEMVALTDIAFPGFFRLRTCLMGQYFGIRSDTGELIAMAGERLAPPGLPELSGVCTHPSHRGRGYAADLIWRVIRHQREQNQQPWLYTTSTNAGAIALYRRLGFELRREAPFTRVRLL